MTSFETERKSSKNHNWHKKCFNCNKCHRVLDATLHYTYDAPDGEIYCKDCFKKGFPTAEMPLIYSDTTVIKPAGEDGGCPRCDGAVFQVRYRYFDIDIISIIRYPSSRLKR